MTEPKPTTHSPGSAPRSWSSLRRSERIVERSANRVAIRCAVILVVCIGVLFLAPSISHDLVLIIRAFQTASTTDAALTELLTALIMGIAGCAAIALCIMTVIRDFSRIIREERHIQRADAIPARLVSAPRDGDR